MKVGIITFHWAANYGAVLQAYALQEAFRKVGAEVEIIDYFPLQYERSVFDCLMSRTVASAKIKMINLRKEKHINKAMEPYLHLSKRYRSSKELGENPPHYDLYVSGSDQIWNPYFTLHGEGAVTLTYFLDFVKSGKCVSYASSIGSVDMGEEYWKCVLPELEKYSQVTVREQSVVDVFKMRGIYSQLVPDPTILLLAEDYSKIEAERKTSFVYYILQENQNKINKIKKYLAEKYKQNQQKDINKVSIFDWLGYIRGAKEILTNSYHGVIFSVIYHTKFYVVPIEGELEGMNDRISTLLLKLGLEDQVVGCIEEVEEIRNKDIDWDKVDKNIDDYRSLGFDVLRGMRGI